MLGVLLWWGLLGWLLLRGEWGCGLLAAVCGGYHSGGIPRRDSHHTVVRARLNAHQDGPLHIVQSGQRQV